jgi:hypothetical protein
MKKHYKILLILIISIGIAISCNKNVLNTEPFDKFSESVVWGSRATADAFVYSAYDAIVRGLYSSNIEYDAYTTNSIDNRGNAITRDEITHDYDAGFDQFSKIRMCNLIIQKAEESTSLTEKDKTELVAEGKLLRAMVYFWQVKRFGRIVWVDHLLDITQTDFKLPLEDTPTSYAKIIQDCDDAIAGLPVESLSGRANKYVAYALKTEVGLQAAAYTGDNSYYQKVVDAADTVINSGIYSLDPDYEGIFNENGRYSKEIILGIYRSKENTYCNDIADLQNVLPNVSNDQLKVSGSGPFFKVDNIFEAWGFWGPSQNLIDDYLVIDNITDNAVRWDQTTQFTQNVTKVTGTDADAIDAGKIIGSGKINEIIYSNRDKRFAASIVYDSCYWFNELVSTCVKGNLNRVSQGGLFDCCVPETNNYWRKGVYNVVPRVYVGIPTDYHWVAFRLGKVYLNKAEALLKMNKIAEAVVVLNVTRTFHGGLPASTATTSSEAWTDYKRERRVELAKESVGDYYFSLLRWGKYGSDANSGREPGAKIVELEQPATFMEISSDRQSYQVIKFIYNNNQIRVFDNTRRYLFPIPQAQIVRNPKFTQNPGW